MFRFATILRFVFLMAVAFALGRAAVTPLCAADPAAPFEGRVLVAISRNNGEPGTYTFTRKGPLLRIEDDNKSRPEPWNVIDLPAKKLTIVFPHNSSFTVIDLVSATSPSTALPPGVANRAANPFPGAPGVANPGPVPPRPGAPPPGFPAIPTMPPNPAGAGPAGMPGMPGMPPMPPMPAFPHPGGGMVLKKLEESREIQGFECSRYEVHAGPEKFEIWATSDAALFPFRLLQRNPNTRRFGPTMIEEEWVALLQKQSLFPLEATLRNESGAGQFSFRVIKVEAGKIDDKGGTLFSAPKDYLEVTIPTF